jgi:hypothetical protein
VQDEKGERALLEVLKSEFGFLEHHGYRRSNRNGEAKVAGKLGTATIRLIQAQLNTGN